MCLLNAWTVASVTEEMNFQFYFILTTLINQI